MSRAPDYSRDSKHSFKELNNCSKQELITMLMAMEMRVDQLSQDMRDLTEQIRIANQDRYGSKTEKLDQLDGQLSFFNEAEKLSEDAPDEEPDIDDVLPKKQKKKKQKGKREEDLKDLPEESCLHGLSDAQLDKQYGAGNWRRLKDEVYKRLKYTPASWSVEVHTVQVAVGTDGMHQDEFIRGDRPRDILRNCIATPSLCAAIMNAKYVNSIPLYRIEQEFQRNSVNISRQSMADWMIKTANRYLVVIYKRLQVELFRYHVTQADETPVNVINDGREKGTKSNSYMWVHRSGEFYKDRPIVLYEYQKTRHHKHPEAYYKDFKGVLVTDGLQQYHLIEEHLPGVTNANCWAHARRSYADAVKAFGKSDTNVLRKTVAYQALVRIAAIYKLESTLKDCTPKERLKIRQKSIKPLVDEYFAWVKERLADTAALPKGKTAQGLNYSVNQEQYLRIFLEDGEVPIDNSASERSIRTFCVGKKNWVLIDSIKGATSSAIIYSLSETAKLNGLNPYYYFEHLLSVS